MNNMLKITGVYKLRYFKNKYRIHLEDQRFFDVSGEFVSKFELSCGTQLKNDEYENLCKEFAYEKAICYISYQERTIFEVRRKLRKSVHGDILIDEIIDDLIEKGYLDDFRYACEFAQSRLKKYGTKKVVYDLIKRGVDKQVIESVLMDVSSEQQEEVALECARKKIIQMDGDNIDSYKKKQRLYSFLCRRGYDYEIVKSVMGQLEI